MQGACVDKCAADHNGFLGHGLCEAFEHVPPSIPSGINSIETTTFSRRYVKTHRFIINPLIHLDINSIKTTFTDEAERLLEMRRASQDATKEENDNGEQKYDGKVERDETDPYDEVIFGRRRPDSVVVDWANKVHFVLEFKRTSDQRRDYREQGESRARAQHDVLIKSLERVARDAEGENEGWKIRLIIFVGGTCGSVNVKTFNDNMNELHVIESKRNAIRKGLAFEFLNAQDTFLC
jgi:hypothetical protein